ncbi:MAG: right-handed parallel beta-helix repeat-containing protein, partial [bacterium]
MGNTIQNSPAVGVYLRGARVRVQGNEITGNRVGMDLYQPSASSSDRIEATGNLVHHNSERGISARDRVWVSDNTVWGHTTNAGVGITAADIAEVASNRVFDNKVGIESPYYS